MRSFPQPIDVVPGDPGAPRGFGDRDSQRGDRLVENLPLGDPRVDERGDDLAFLDPPRRSVDELARLGQGLQHGQRHRLGRIGVGAQRRGVQLTQHFARVKVPDNVDRFVRVRRGDGLDAQAKANGLVGGAAVFRVRDYLAGVPVQSYQDRSRALAITLGGDAWCHGQRPPGVPDVYVLGDTAFLVSRFRLDLMSLRDVLLETEAARAAATAG